MPIKAEFEDFAITEAQKYIIETAIAVVNDKHTDIHAALDSARSLLTAAGYWVYRGGFHIALHFMQADGTPQTDRSVLIS